MSTDCRSTSGHRTAAACSAVKRMRTNSGGRNVIAVIVDRRRDAGRRYFSKMRMQQARMQLTDGGCVRMTMNGQSGAALSATTEHIRCRVIARCMIRMIQWAAGERGSGVHAWSANGSRTIRVRMMILCCPLRVRRAERIFRNVYGRRANAILNRIAALRAGTTDGGTSSSGHTYTKTSLCFICCREKKKKKRKREHVNVCVCVCVVEMNRLIIMRFKSGSADTWGRSKVNGKRINWSEKSRNSNLIWLLKLICQFKVAL